MIKIESLKNYLNTDSKEEFINLTNKIYEITNFLCEDYPEYNEWFFNKQLLELNKKERNIFFIR